MARLCPPFKSRAPLRRVPDLVDAAQDQIHTPLEAGMSAADARMSARYVAGFGGSMRKNLVSMLDGIGVAEVLDVRSTERLFAADRAHVHSTSVFRHPVFIRGKNYTGHGGHLERSAFGQACIRDLFVSELDALPEALVVPMGGFVSGVIKDLVSRNLLDERRCLMGFPHPSGANGHRRSQFEAQKSELMEKTRIWLRRS